MFSRFRQIFWQPPRAHGDIIEDRSVSFLELFYDLVYVVVIARAAHTLAGNVSWRGFWEFAVVFGLIWFAWLNGTLYHELHSRPDGRSRVYIFIQMILIAVLAVFTADATGDSGTQFALVYAGFSLLLWWLWYTVRRQDEDVWSRITARYLTGLALVIVALVATAWWESDGRTVVWALIIVLSLLGAVLQSREEETSFDLGMSATDSMVERFGLFTIIVLGEVVVGVVDGLSESERSFETIATGVVGLMIGFAYWWTYFDFVGRRLPVQNARKFTQWMAGHLPVTLSIAASGAALVSLIEHAGDDRAPQATAWLLTGSVAVGLLSFVLIMYALADYKRLESIYDPLTNAIAVGAAVALVLGWARPAPWGLALSIVVMLGAVWLVAVDRWLRMDDPEEALP